MDELIKQLTTYARGVWNRRWVGLAVAWLVGVIGAVVVWQIPDKYEASARIYVDTDSVLRPLLSGLAVQPDVTQQVNILSRTLISRPNVERLIRMTDLDLKLQTPAAKEAVIESLTKDIKIVSAGRDNIYTINYRDPSPEQGKKVVQSLVSIFVESGLGDKRKDADSARRFIEEQIKTYEKRLEESENRLKEFKLRNMGAVGTEGRDFFGRMGQLGEELASAKLELRAAEQSRDALKREVAGEDPVFLPDDNTAVASTPVPEIDARIDALKKNLDELLRRYTDQHPDVVGTRRVIEELEKQKKEELAARAKAAGSSGAKRSYNVNTNPVYQQLKVSLAEAEANVASLRGRVAELEGRLNQLRTAAKLQPQIEAELQQLNRDYEIQKRQYESLVTRRESASISGDMDAAGTAEFRLIDPPRSSPTPVTPNRLALVPLVLLGAIGAGIIASLLVSQVWPTFHDSRSLRAATGRPVLGSVSAFPTPMAVRRNRRLNLAFASGIAGLIAVYGAWLAWVAAHTTRVLGA
jgi:polysaccharide chain length determinant protein (PEP-CTERM system associated)